MDLPSQELCHTAGITEPANTAQAALEEATYAYGISQPPE